MNELVSARPDRPESYGARFRESMREALRVVLDFALPQLCPCCREPVSEGKRLCAPCWSKLSLIEPPYRIRLVFHLPMTWAWPAVDGSDRQSTGLQTGLVPSPVTTMSPALWYTASNIATGSTLHP